MEGVAKSKEHLAHVLGEAIIRIWSRLPQDVQHDLFAEVLACEGEALRQPLAVFLHGKHTRTWDSIKARAMPEPDSQGG